jgi:propionate CoA-transferase
MTLHPALPYLRSSEKGKVVTAAEAARLIRDGDTVATGGFVGIGFAEEIAVALEELYLAPEAEAPYGTGKPHNLTLKQFPAYLNRWDSQQARNEGVFAH